MKKKPLISVLICVYNEEDEIEGCLKSVLNQTYQHFEIIIVDDGSVDKTSKIIKKIKDKRIKYYYKKNEGLTKSLNYGLKFCKGEFIARLDADNRCVKNRFEKQINYFEKNPEVVLVGGLSKKTISSTKEIISEKISKLNITKQLMIGPTIPHSSIMVKGNILRNEKYDETFRTSQDYELYVRLASKYKIVKLTEVLVKAKIKENSITRSKTKWENLKTHTRIRWKAYKVLDVPWYYFIHILRGFVRFLIPRKLYKI
ncbi:MAG: glycosyltransferase family 2 protein [archaeon]